MKVNTVEQYKVLEFIKDKFHMADIELKLIDRNTIEVTDQNGDIMQFKYDNGKVIYE